MTQKTKKRNKAEAKKVVISFTPNAWDEYTEWQKKDPKVADHINVLLKECQRTPFTGIGKPEPLMGDLTGYWSRRITKEHRLVYLPEDGQIYVVQCMFHY